MTTGKTIVLTRQTFVGKVMSLLFNMLSRLVITFLPRSKRLLISWLQLPSAVVSGKMWIDTSSQNTYIINKLLYKYTFNSSYVRPLPRLLAWSENSESWHCQLCQWPDVSPFCVFSSLSNFFFFFGQSQVAPDPWVLEQLFLLLLPHLSLFSTCFLPLILERDFDPSHLNSKQRNWQKWERWRCW